MNDYQNINTIIQESIRDSSYLSVIISSCVFIVYTFINKLIDYFKAKDSHKPIIEIGNAVREMGNNVAKLNNVLDKTFQDNTKREVVRCKNTIDLAFTCFHDKVYQTCRDIIIHNNIDNNRELIVNNLSKVVNTEYYNVSSVLAMYEINGVLVSTHLKEKWIEDVINNIINIIYNKQDDTSRITSINNTLNILVDNYTTYMNNKTFNNN